MACYKHTILMAVFGRMPTRIVLNPDVSYSFNIPTQSLEPELRNCLFTNKSNQKLEQSLSGSHTSRVRARTHVFKIYALKTWAVIKFGRISRQFVDARLSRNERGQAVGLVESLQKVL